MERKETLKAWSEYFAEGKREPITIVRNSSVQDIYINTCMTESIHSQLKYNTGK
jgi:hypothetical protein